MNQFSSIYDQRVTVGATSTEESVVTPGFTFTGARLSNAGGYDIGYILGSTGPTAGRSTLVPGASIEFSLSPGAALMTLTPFSTEDGGVAVDVLLLG